MGFRVRKSFKVMPGVRMTVTPRGVSTSIGGRGARVTVNSKGRVTRTVGIPGTGVSYVSSTSAQSAGRRRVARKAAPQKAAPQVAAPKKTTMVKAPGWLAPRWEKLLFQAVAAPSSGAFQQVAIMFPKARMTCMMLDLFLARDMGSDAVTRKALAEALWDLGYDPDADHFLTTYARGGVAHVTLAPDVEASLPISRELIGLTLVEFRQSVGDLDGAVAVAEALAPTTAAAVSLADLYMAQERWDDVIRLAGHVDGSDQFSAFLARQREVAMQRRKGQLS